MKKLRLSNKLFYPFAREKNQRIKKDFFFQFYILFIASYPCSFFLCARVKFYFLFSLRLIFLNSFFFIYFYFCTFLFHFGVSSFSLRFVIVDFTSMHLSSFFFYSACSFGKINIWEKFMSLPYSVFIVFTISYFNGFSFTWNL